MDPITAAENTRKALALLTARVESQEFSQDVFVRAVAGTEPAELVQLLVGMLNLAWLYLKEVAQTTGKSEQEQLRKMSEFLARLEFGG